jgi:hypothetical protein
MAKGGTHFRNTGGLLQHQSKAESSAGEGTDHILLRDHGMLLLTLQTSEHHAGIKVYKHSNANTDVTIQEKSKNFKDAVEGIGHDYSQLEANQKSDQHPVLHKIKAENGQLMPKNEKLRDARDLHEKQFSEVFQPQNEALTATIRLSPSGPHLLLSTDFLGISTHLIRQQQNVEHQFLTIHPGPIGLKFVSTIDYMRSFHLTCNSVDTDFPGKDNLRALGTPTPIYLTPLH